MLKKKFIDLVKNYSKDEHLAENLWCEIAKNYSSTKKHYHTLEHLENLYIQLLEVKSKIEDWNCILFTLFYHDIIYKSTKSNNEAKSAAFAMTRMEKIGVPTATIIKCKNQILATKKHLFSESNDTNFFTDADLSILGQEWNLYEIYYKNVRKEYYIFPNFIYNSGRKKAIAHFLAMEKIFKTDYFFKKYDLMARTNLQREFDLL